MFGEDWKKSNWLESLLMIVYKRVRKEDFPSGESDSISKAMDRESCEEYFWNACMLSRVQLFVTPWTVVHQTPLSVEFSRQEYWSGLPFPTLASLSDLSVEHKYKSQRGKTMLELYYEKMYKTMSNSIWFYKL